MAAHTPGAACTGVVFSTEAGSGLQPRVCSRPRVLVSAVPIEEGASEKTAAYKGTPGGWLRIEQ